MTIIAVVLVLIGSAFGLLAALGLLRFPDLFTRLHATAKAGPLGAGLIFLGIAAGSADPLVAVRCTLGIVFLMILSPISAHLLARTTVRLGLSAPNITSIKNIDNSRRH